MPGIDAVREGTRIPTLDGWRCIAILMVLFTHYQIAFLGHTLGGNLWLYAGQHGVQIFFVLSGYLITTRLFAEDKINLARFYVRRFFRLMPAAWVYLLFLGILTLYTGFKVLGNDIWACLFFYRNYVAETAANTCTQHYWSLSLEEQFYLVWPPVLVLLGRRRACITAAVTVACLAFYRALFWDHFREGIRYISTPMRADALLVGCLLAFLLQSEAACSWFRRHGRWLFLGCLPPLAWDIYTYHDLIPLHETLLIAAVLACTSLNPRMLVSRFLEYRHIRATGMLSYGIYIWQGVFLRPAWGRWGPLMLTCAFLTSWLVIEQPSLRLGKRLLARKKRTSLREPVLRAD